MNDSHLAESAQRLLDSGVFAPAWYALLIGRRLGDPMKAATHYVAHGMPRLLPPHPLIDPAAWPGHMRTAWAKGDLGPLARFQRPLATQPDLGFFIRPKDQSLDEEQYSSHPGGLPGWLIREAPAELTVVTRVGPLTMGKVRGLWRRMHTELTAAADPDTSTYEEPTEEIPLRDARARLGAGLIQWDRASASERVPGRVSLVIPSDEDWTRTSATIEAVFANTADADTEIIVVDDGSDLPSSMRLFQLHAPDPRVTFVRLARGHGYPLAANHGATFTTGEFVGFLSPGVLVRRGWLEPLRARLTEPGVLGTQPLILDEIETIRSAGYVLLADDSSPTAFLRGLQPDDAREIGTQRFAAVSSDCLLMRWETIRAHAGFDSSFVAGMADIDLCLRVRAADSGHFAVEPASLVTQLDARPPVPEELAADRRIWRDRWSEPASLLDLARYEEVGFVVAGLAGEAIAIPEARPLLVRDRTDGRRRWGVRHAAVSGGRGDLWGDTYFADSLAHALRAAGADAVTYRRDAFYADGTVFDDVNLVLRGLIEAVPLPGAINILWIISHPEAITVDELRAFDLVYASSASWAEHATQWSGREVRVLLQATDTRTFHMHSGTRPTAPLTFVGGNYPAARSRPVVEDALVSGVPLRIIGRGWDHLEPGIVESQHVDNSELGEVYRNSSIVLADHWADMAAQGFLQNRLFDAVACGSAVISDEVVGLRDVFGSLVQTYRDLDEFRMLCSPEGAHLFGTAEERAQQAEAIRAHHSFDARASQLLSDVAELLGKRAQEVPQQR